MSQSPSVVSDSTRDTLAVLPGTRTPLGKQRAWLRMTLMEKGLAQALDILVADAGALARFALFIFLAGLPLPFFFSIHRATFAPPN
jgi:hypothetical protein